MARPRDGVPLAEQLRSRLPNLFAFALGFALVANVWWEHHKPVARLAYVVSRSTALNLLALGLVALASPVAVLAVAALKSPLIGAFMGRRALLGYADWA